MSFSIDTLQDFVMGLVNDEAAKAAYLADPLAALSDAGLADLTPADVQEVLPLIADSLPAGLPTDLSALPVAVPGVDALPSLDALPNLAAPSLGDLPLDLPDFGHLPGFGDLPELPSVPALPTLETPLGDLSTVVGGNAANVGLDGDLIDSATSGFLSNPDNGDAPTVSNLTETAFGDLAAGAKLDPQEFGGSLAGSTDLADAGLGLVGHAGGDTAAWAALDTVAGDLGAGVLAGPEGAGLVAESPLGNIEANTHGDFSIQPANPGDLLDVDHLGDTGDAVAGTVAHYVSTGVDAASGGVADGGDTLAGFLTGPAAPLGGLVETGTDTVTEGLATGGDTVSEHLTNLPTLDGLPLDQLPELPQLPEVPDIDNGNLPQLPDLGDLPVDLPSLPIDLPDTGAVTGLVTDNAVTDAVHASPVGGLLDNVTGHLPQVADLPGDLDLGL